MNILSNISQMFMNAEMAKNKCGTTVIRQLLEILKLRKIGIGIKDYYQYRLYDNSRFDNFEEKTTYRGWRFKDQFRHFSNIQIQGIAFHKHILYRLLESFGLPSPKIFSLYCAIADGFERHRAITEPTGLEKYLLDTVSIPFFGKPSNASHGYGAIGVREKENRNFLLADGEWISVHELVNRIHSISLKTGAYMITEYLQPEENFKRISGSTLPSTRMVVLIRNGKPELYKCATLLPQNQRHVSNFQGGANKSLSAGIDPESGKLFRVMNSEFEYVEHHPFSREKLEGYVLPQWKEARDLILTAAMAFSPFRMQHWDLAFTDRGPVILELNFIGDIEPLQMHGPPGMFTDQFKSFFETHKIW